MTVKIRKGLSKLKRVSYSDVNRGRRNESSRSSARINGNHSWSRKEEGIGQEMRWSINKASVSSLYSGQLGGSK